MFLNVFVHFYLEMIVWKWNNKSCKVGGFQNTCFFFKVQQVTFDLSEGMWERALLKPLNNYPLVTMSKSLCIGENKAYFRSYLV